MAPQAPVRYVSLRAYARMRKAAGKSGHSHVAVHKAISSSRLSKSVVRTAAGVLLGVNPELADSEWDGATDPSQQRDEPAGGRPKTEQTFFEQPESVPDSAEVAARRATGLTLQRARAVREGYLAKQAELDFKKRTGELVEAKDVAHEAKSLGRELRDAVLNACQRVGPELASIHEPRKCTDVLIRAVTAALAKLCDEG